MKKLFFTLFIISALLLFTLFSCTKSSCLYDVVMSITLNDETTPAGVVMCYGHGHDNSINDNTLSEYLGINGYPEFKDKIEELCVYSSVGEKYYELAAMKLYAATDTPDGVLFMERRINSARRSGMFDIDTSAAKEAYVTVYGNTVVLFMMKDNETIENELKRII